MRNNLPILALITILAGGCANIPKAKLTYYLPKTKVFVTVTQTALCIETKKPIVKTNVVFKPMYVADHDNAAQFDYESLETFYSTGGGTITLSKDGRLESFDSTLLGVGKDIVETLVSIRDFDRAKELIEPPGPNEIDTACKKINELAGKTKGVQNPLSVIVTAEVNFKKSKDPKKELDVFYDFKLNSYPEKYYKDIEPALGQLDLEGVVEKTLRNTVTPTADNGLTLVEPVLVKLSLRVTDYSINTITTHSSVIEVSQLGKTYKLAIPSPPFFGTNNMELTLHESGRIKKLKYGKTSGVTDANASLSTINSHLKDPTNKEKAEDLKAQADIIAQQTRLIACEADPTTCK